MNYLLVIMSSKSNINTKGECSRLGIPPTIAHWFFRINTIRKITEGSNVIGTKIKTTFSHTQLCNQSFWKRITKFYVAYGPKVSIAHPDIILIRTCCTVSINSIKSIVNRAWVCGIDIARISWIICIISPCLGNFMSSHI